MFAKRRAEVSASGCTKALVRNRPSEFSPCWLGGSAGNPVALFSTVPGRDFRLKLNPSAVYVITRPTQPEDQLDWNKLPGFSDCGTLDLSANGAMFGWRWRLDLTPPVLEVTAYANNYSKHLWSASPLFTLSAADLASEEPLRYRVWIDGSRYQFAVSGTVRGRTISAATTPTGSRRIIEVWPGRYSPAAEPCITRQAPAKKRNTSATAGSSSFSAAA